MTTQEKAQKLIERYVHAVGEQLPRKQRDDVVAEMRTLLQDALDERAQAAGRPPDEEMAVEVLLEFGEPGVIAQRYLPVPRYFIGPELYPAFVLTAKVVLSVVGVLLLAGLVLSAGFGRGRWAEFPAGLAGAFKYLGWVVQTLFINLAIVAAVFAVIERIRARQKAEGKLQAEKWNPRELPEVEDTERVSAAGRVWRIYCIVVFFIVLNFFPQFFGVIFFSGDEVRTLPVFDLGVRIPVLLLNLWWVLALALNMTLLQQGRWSFATRWWEFGLGLFGALILYVTLTGSVFIADVNWFAEHGWVESAGSVKVGEKLLPFFNRVLRGALWVALFFALLESAQRMWRLSTRYREQWARLLSFSVW